MRSSGPTVLDLLRANAERHPEKLLYAFLDKHGRTTESYTYESFLRRVREIASFIHPRPSLSTGESRIHTWLVMMKSGREPKVVYRGRRRSAS